MDRDHETSISGSSSGVPIDMHREKRLRAGSISGRLRTASDLEEWGWIDKSQKGVVKDLIISGNQNLQVALEKFEKGDPSDLQAMIRQGAFARKHSIDLLDGLDLDFLNVEGGGDMMGGLDAEFSFENHFDDGVMGMDLFGTGGAHDLGADGQDKTFDRDWFMRRMSIGSDTMGTRGRSNTTEWQMQAQGVLLDDRIGADIFSNTDWGDNLHGEVDMSAYESHAALLQNSGTSGKGQQQLLRLNKRQLSKSTGGAGSGSSSSSGAAPASTSSKPRVSLALNKATSAAPAPVPAPAPAPAPAAAAVAVPVPPSVQWSGTIPGPSAAPVTVVPPIVISTGSDPLKGAKVGWFVDSSDSGSVDLLPGTGSTVLSNPPQQIGGPGLLPPNPGFSSGALPSQQFGGVRPIPVPGFDTSAPIMPVLDPATSGGPASFVTTEDGLVRSQPGFIGAYSPESRKERVERFLEKRHRRVWTKKVKYDVRKNFADSRLRVKGRFVKKEDEELMRELLSI